MIEFKQVIYKNHCSVSAQPMLGERLLTAVTQKPLAGIHKVYYLPDILWLCFQSENQVMLAYTLHVLNDKLVKSVKTCDIATVIKKNLWKHL